MVAGLVGRLSARFVFVVGKGGVGKSTSAAALALELADRGTSTHLLSTDPAHSLGDLFDQPLDGRGPTTSACSPSLSLEELDAGERGRRWFAEVGDAVAELVDRGTYLDREDVAALLDHSLPGVDEVMAALRMAELSDGEAHERVVVDTAPTGHTLRLLDSGTVLGGWVDAMDAMAAKAGAVATGLTGRRVRFAGQRVIDGLAADVRRFGEDVLADADFVIVTREGGVVAAETARLTGELRNRGLRVAALVRVGGGPGLDDGSGDGPALDGDGWRDGPPGSAVPVLDVPSGDRLTGCAGLRRWGLGRVPDGRAGADGMRPPGRRALDVLPRRDLVLFAGKGGVGKSTCAAAYAAAQAGERSVLLVSLDPAGSLGDVFGRPVAPGGTRLEPGLVARQLDAETAFARFRDRYRERVRRVFERLGLDRSARLDRRVLESVLEIAPPGLDEIFALDTILDSAGTHDVVVLDTAPTGHFLRLLEMPGTALSWTRTVLRILLKYRAVLGLDDFAEDLVHLARRLRSLTELLRDPDRTAVMVVTLDEELPRRESERLAAELGARGSPIAAMIRNRWVPGDSSRTSKPAPAGIRGPDTDTILAPLTAPSPVGSERLLDFATRWARP